MLAAALPVVLWHRVVGDIASEFRLDLRYLVTGWAPWVLMLMGLACFIGVMVRDWRDPERRFYGPGSGALMGWGLTLYLLGFLLATQVARVAEALQGALGR